MQIRFRSAGVLYRAAAVFFAVFLLIRPQKAYEGAVQGLLLWYKNVLPVQFPFFIAVRLLRDSGCLDRMAILLEPIMRNLFHLPGEASIALAAGWISGYPVGGQLALNLYEEKRINEVEYMHLIRFCNVPGPLFVITAVGVRMLGNAAAGYVLLASQWMAAVLYGILFRPKQKPQSNAYMRASGETALGGQLRTAIEESVNTIVMVGGFIILFSVILSLLPEHWLVIGLEMTNGCSLLSGMQIPWRIGAIGFLLGWGGVCVLLQIAASVKGGPRLTGRYWISRFLIGILAGGISCFLSGFLNA